MFDFGLGLFAGWLGFKKLKLFIDNNYRKKVIPEEGSVLYAELMIAVQHSGIYIGNEEISNIKVHKLLKGEAEVEIADRSIFTEKSYINKNIYVSSNKDGAVGDIGVSNYAKSRVGKSWDYNLFNHNCHVFCRRCLDESTEIKDYNISEVEIDETWEQTIRALKRKAKRTLGATKWYIWDDKENSQNSKDNMPSNVSNADIKKMIEEYEKYALSRKGIKNLKEEEMDLKDYIEEISDEDIPKDLVDKLKNIQSRLEKINKDVNGKYRGFLNFSTDKTNNEEDESKGYSYSDLQKLPEDTNDLIREIELNNEIKKMVNKLGKNITEKEIDVSKRKNIKEQNPTQVSEIYKSSDLLRILLSELTLLENEELETLFYSKMYENSLLTYRLKGEENKKIEEIEKEKIEIKGPVVACLDTSGSMGGNPIFKAKSLLLSIANILEKENRKLYILLFGASNQITEYSIENKGQIIGLLNFLRRGYNGGTDFNTPLKRAINIIENEKKEYNKADILFITDGLCDLSTQNLQLIEEKKKKLDFQIYTVICGNNSYNSSFFSSVNKNFRNQQFSDEILYI